MLDDRLWRLEEPARTPDELAVGVNLTLPAEVADDVPVQSGLVLRPAVGEARAKRQVDGAADLLVEEDVPRPAVDLVVQPEGELAEDASAVVGVEQRAQVVRAAASVRVDHPPTLEAQTDVLNLTTVEDGGQGKADLPLGLRLDRAREDLAVRHVVGAVRRLPGPPGDPEPQVGVRPDDPDLARVRELGGPRSQLLCGRAPVRDGILVAVDVTGAEDEVLVLEQRHLRVRFAASAGSRGSARPRTPVLAPPGRRARTTSCSPPTRS